MGKTGAHAPMGKKWALFAIECRGDLASVRVVGMIGVQ